MDTRIHVVLPKSMVKEIDELVGPRKRSEFIFNAVDARLTSLRQLKALKAAAGSLKDYDFPDWSTPEKTSDWVHRNRQLDDEMRSEQLKGRGW